MTTRSITYSVRAATLGLALVLLISLAACGTTPGPSEAKVKLDF